MRFYPDVSPDKGLAVVVLMSRRFGAGRSSVVGFNRVSLVLLHQCAPAPCRTAGGVATTYEGGCNMHNDIRSEVGLPLTVL